MSRILDRIEREVGVPGLVDVLAERIRPADLQSVLLEVYRRRASRRDCADVLSDYAKNRFVRPSPVQPARLEEWERVLTAELPEDFEQLILSPVGPLGTASVLAGVSQDWAVSTSRNTEVVSDSTNVLALECALRRRSLIRSASSPSVPVHLATSHRLLRGQKFEGPDSWSHFSAFVLCSAGRDAGNLEFELDSMAVHVRFHARAIRGFLGGKTRLKLAASDFSTLATETLLEERLFARVREEFPDLECRVDHERKAGRNYYRDVCFKMHATAPGGRTVELADGGSVDWTQKLLGSKKERLVISGIGSDRVCTAFGRQSS